MKLRKEVAFLLGLFMSCNPIVVQANATVPTSVFTIGKGTYSVNGMVRNDAPPYIENGRVYLPLRYVAYSCGIGDNSIYWDQEKQTAYLLKSSNLLAVKIGEQFITLNGKKVPMDAKATYKQGRVMLPLRAISEALNCIVQWDGGKKQVVIIPDASIKQ
ncbi:copper amine oxidase N-terminal domain-containing protein [Aneurinibacillus terranovensis]|uniref:copper amine oxidase N-terminal domain-containing protein n=1 Tax=Aneurinibacillus terranovensis TaxID=278991 RepID=UPI0004817CF2|nr:copper amine oxidase N-terminal domain-containing protein [Aneurinibacillus terranovensis]